jgi:hypothetical protein
LLTYPYVPGESVEVTQHPGQQSEVSALVGPVSTCFGLHPFARRLIGGGSRGATAGEAVEVDLVRTAAAALTVAVPSIAAVAVAIRKVSTRMDADQRDAAMRVLEAADLSAEQKAVVENPRPFGALKVRILPAAL